MQRRLCSYDIAAVPDACYVVTESDGEMYFCNARCLAVWALMLATKPGLSEEAAARACVLTKTNGEQMNFETLKSLGRWAAANALS